MPPYAGGSTSLNDFKHLSLLGEGAYSGVYKVLRYADKEIYALKKVKLPSLSDKEKQNALNEVRLLASVVNKHIIAYKEAFFDERTRCLCIVQEYADGGDLLQQVVKCQKERKHIPEADVWRYLNGMVQGLKALHNMQILHRDLKCANVFLHNSPDGLIAKLGDFNVSKVAKRGLCMTQTGTPYYASPEVWRDMPYDNKSDMWSLGCVLYEMLALRPPFRAEDMEGLYKKVLRGQYHRIPPHYSHDVAEVIATLLQVNPRHRPSVDQLMQMPLLRRHIPELGGGGPELRPMDLLSTIKLPSNAIDISGMLPQPRYDLPKVLDDGLATTDDGAGSSRSGGARPKRGYGGLGQPGPLGVRAPREPREESVGPPPPSNVPAAQRDSDSAPVPSHTGDQDSLDALRNKQSQQQHQRLPPARQPARQSEVHEEAPSEYGAQSHASRVPSELPPVQPHQGRLYQHQPRSETNSQAGGPQAGRGRYNPRPPGHEVRRAMASYARPQYSLNSQQGSAPNSQRPQAPKPTGTDAARRLPPIFAPAA